MKAGTKKYPKALAAVVLLLAMAVGLAGCRVNFDGIGEGARMDKTVNALVEAIQENDPDAVTQLFSKAVREEIGDERLKEGTGYLHALLEGDTVSIKQISRSAGETNNGLKKRRYLHPYYRVVTTSDTYLMQYIFYTVDRITPDYIGMFNLWVIKESDKDRGYIRDDEMGIYMPRTIDGSELGVPHEYRTEYWSFTVPAGYYKDDSVSTDDKYYFTIEEVILSDVIYSHFSIAFANSDIGANGLDTFRDNVLIGLNDKLHYLEEPYGELSSGDEYTVEELVEETAQGYPLLKYSIVRDGKLLHKYYYIIGDMKYALAQYTFQRKPDSSGQPDAEKPIIAAAESLVDSFVWVDGSGA